MARLNFRTIVETRVPRTTREFNFPASERVDRVGGAGRELIHDLLTNRLPLGSIPLYHRRTFPYLCRGRLSTYIEGIPVLLHQRETREIFRHGACYVRAVPIMPCVSTRDC